MIYTFPDESALRLRCLELAICAFGGNSPEDIVSAAKGFHRYVTGAAGDEVTADSTARGE